LNSFEKEIKLSKLSLSEGELIRRRRQ